MDIQHSAFTFAWLALSLHHDQPVSKPDNHIAHIAKKQLGKPKNMYKQPIKRNYKSLRTKGFIDRSNPNTKPLSESPKQYSEAELQTLKIKEQKRNKFIEEKKRIKELKTFRKKRIEDKLSKRKRKGSIPQPKPESRAEYWEYKLRI